MFQINDYRKKLWKINNIKTHSKVGNSNFDYPFFLQLLLHRQYDLF